MQEEATDRPVVPLSLLLAVRRRPGMYFGDSGPRAVNAAICEVIANAVDQYLAGLATTVTVAVQDASFTVSDDGRGMPFDRPSPDTGCASLAEYYFLNRHESATADGHAPHVHIVGHGLGLAVINAASESIKAISSNGSSVHTQLFGKGQVLSACTIEHRRASPGTRLEVVLDREVFGALGADLGELRKTLFELAHFYPGLAVEFQQERFIVERGLLDLACIYYAEPCTVRSPGSRPTLYFHGQSEGIEVQIAAIGSGAEQIECRSWVNGMPSVEGGTHEAAMPPGLRR